MQKLRSSIEKAFGIHPEEFVRVQAFFLFLATISVFYSMGASVGDTLFLSRFGSAEAQRLLPWVYIGIGLITIALTWVYDRLEHRYSRASILIVSHVLLAASVAAFRTVIRLDNRWVYFGLVVWLEACALVCLMLFFSCAGGYFTSRDARRLYGYINGGVAVGGILGGLSVDILSRWVRLDDLLYVCASTLVAGSVWAGVIASSFAGVGEEEDDAAVSKAPLSAIVSSRYMQAILVMVAATQVFGGLTDYQLKVAASRSMDEAHLAVFFGRFYSALGLVQLPVQFLFVGWLLKRAGVVSSLLVLPVLMILSNGVFLIHPVLITAAAAAFARLALLETLDEPAQEILFIPLTARLRVRAQAVVEGALLPLGICAVGVILLLLGPVSSQIRVFPATGMVFGCIWIGAIVVLRGQYIQTLADSLKKRRMNAADLYTLLNGKDSYKIISDLLRSNNSQFGLAALEMIKGRDIAPFAAEVEALIQSEDEDVAVTALELLGSTGRRACLAATRRAVYDLRPSVRTAAVLASGRIMGEEIIQKAEEWLNAGDPHVRRAALLACARFGGYKANMMAQKRLISILENPGTEERIEAMRLLGQIGGRGAGWIISRFFNDPDPLVRREAVLAAGTLKDQELIPKLLDRLGDISMRRSAIEALGMMPEAAAEKIGDMAVNRSLNLACRLGLVRILGNVGGSRSYRALWRVIQSDDDLALRVTAAKSIRRIHFRKDLSVVVDDVDACLMKFAAEAKLMARILQAFPKENGSSVDLWADHARLQLEFIVALLALRLDPKRFRHIDRQLLGTSQSLKANAIEYIELALPRPVAAAVVPALDPPPLRNGTSLPSLLEKLSARETWIRGLILFHMLHETDENHLRGETMSPEDKNLVSVIMTTASLKQVNLFKNVPANFLAALAEIAEPRTFFRGEAVFSRGDTGDSLYLITDGRIGIFVGDKQVNQLGPGECLGEMALIDSQPRSATAVAAEDSQAIRISSDGFWDVLSAQPEVAKALLQTLAQRLRQSLERPAT